ncbi:MAG TPA: UDP-N-acetylmuramyl-tripeptide synthetase [Polyangiaceae bacterium]|nr:UDP-N-acetylmuramyl-tripeptide synthetase [Polyangiaceae bacterium]
MRIVGVTGTNGKTTTATMLANIVRCAGEADARVTTLGSWVAGERLSDQTDVEAFTRCLERARQQGVRTLVLETTSKALAEGFAHHFPVDVAVFTSFSRDHLDYHGSPEQYLAAKAQLFATLRLDGAAVLNADSEAAALIDEVTPPSVRRLWYARADVSHAPHALKAQSVHVSVSGTRIGLQPSPLAEGMQGTLELRVHGEHFAEDALAAALGAHALGYSASAIREGLSTHAGVPGRFEVVHRDPLVVVDYAHTPDALARTLGVARTVNAGGRVIVVFGCGGERDQGKRSEMGRMAAGGADLCILTSDNPRTEDPEAILAEIAQGARAGGALEEDPAALLRTFSSAGPCVVTRVVDRRGAIALALDVARHWTGSCVVVAGKGHEDEQCIGTEIFAFHDPTVVHELISGAKRVPHEGSRNED